MVRSNDFKNIIVSWISLRYPLSSYFVAYEVEYTKCFHDGECEAKQSVNITERSLNHYTLLDITLWVTYNFTVYSHFSICMNTYTLPGAKAIETIGNNTYYVCTSLCLLNNYNSEHALI